MCLGALGTQTGGSVTRPASYCGVYSLKPTYGRVSVDGVLPLAPSLDHVGVMANCVRDLAVLFQAIAGPDEHCGFSFRGHHPTQDVVGAVDRVSDASSEPVFSVLGGLFTERLAREARPRYEALIDKISEAVSVLDRAVPPPGFAELPRMHRILMAVEAARYHGGRLRGRANDYPSKIRALIEEGLRYAAVDYCTAQRLNGDLEDQVTRMLNGQRVFVTPATMDAAPGIETTGDPAFNSPWSFTGHPTISLPYACATDELPLAAQLVGSPMCEDDLFASAAWLEAAIGFEHRPLPL
jgi:aspartyl-tRNA(Asn)/glutamyl-tRNA(Gln) amidotransferase subunit A